MMATRIANRLQEATSENIFIYDTFHDLDADNTGYVTTSEFKAAVKKLALPLQETEVQALIQKFKSNVIPDGISYRDFIKFVESTARHLLGDKR